MQPTHVSISLLTTVPEAPDLLARLAALQAENRSLLQALARCEARLAAAEHEARTDPLTGLPNRRAWLGAAEREAALAKRGGRPCAVLLVDLDHFKRLNDARGHAAGDAALKAVARALEGAVRLPDVVARHGGEEFLVLCPDTDLAAAGLVAERLRAAVAATSVPELLGDPQPAGSPRPQAQGLVRASIGVAAWRAGDVDVEALVARADRALYRAKAAGRDRVAIEG